MRTLNFLALALSIELGKCMTIDTRLILKPSNILRHPYVSPDIPILDRPAPTIFRRSGSHIEPSSNSWTPGTGTETANIPISTPIDFEISDSVSPLASENWQTPPASPTPSPSPGRGSRQSSNESSGGNDSKPPSTGSIPRNMPTSSSSRNNTTTSRPSSEATPGGQPTSPGVSKTPQGPTPTISPGIYITSLSSISATQTDMPGVSTNQIVHNSDDKDRNRENDEDDDDNSALIAFCPICKKPDIRGHPIKISLKKICGPVCKDGEYILPPGSIDDLAQDVVNPVLKIKDGKPTLKDQPTEDNPNKPTPSSRSSPAESSSSRSECPETTVSSCEYFATCSTSVGSTTSTSACSVTSSTCSPTVGCSATDTATTTTASSTPTVKPGRYIINFKKGTTKDDKVSFIKDLLKEVSEDNIGTTVDAFKDDITLVVAQLQGNEEALKSQIVEELSPDVVVQMEDIQGHTFNDEDLDEENPVDTEPRAAGNLTKRETGDIIAVKANPEVMFFSQPKNPRVPVFDLKSFAFDNRAGAGVTIYSLDLTADLEHEEFNYEPSGWIKGSVEHLEYSDLYGNLLMPMAPGQKAPKPRREDADPHGTCIASKVVGKRFGLAKGANLIAGQMRGAGGSYHASSIIKTLNEAIKDIVNKRKKDPYYIALVPLSFSLELPIKGLRDALDTFAKLDVLVAIASGKDPEANPYPRVYKRDFKNIAVVGGIDGFGRKTPDSPQDDLVDMNAPSLVWLDGNYQGVECAKPMGGTRRARGSSVASPQYVAAAAYFASTESSLIEQGKTAENLIEHIKSKGSFKRGNTAEFLPAIWNGINQAYEPQGECGKGQRKRDDGEACTPAATSDPSPSSSNSVSSGVSSLPPVAFQTNSASNSLSRNTTPTPSPTSSKGNTPSPSGHSGTPYQKPTSTTVQTDSKTSSGSATPTSEPKKADKCHVQMGEAFGPGDDDPPLYLSVLVKNAKGDEAGEKSGEGTFSEPFEIETKLEHNMNITPNIENFLSFFDYLRMAKQGSSEPISELTDAGFTVGFKYGDKSWSGTDSGCEASNWSKGSYVNEEGKLVFGKESVTYRTIDCDFDC